MVLKNQTKMTKEHIKAVMRASNFENNRYKSFKLFYNFFGLLFGMMFVRYFMFDMLGSSQQNNALLVIYGAVTAVFLYIGMYGMDRSNYKKYYGIYGNMVGITFTYEIDGDGINVIDEDNDNEFFEWERVINWTEDLDRFFVYVGMEECLILNKNAFVEGDSADFKELITAVMGLRKEQEELEKQEDIKKQEAAMQIRRLTEEEISGIYNEHLVKDFPAGEVKPLKTILERFREDKYFAYGMFEKEELIGYAFTMNINPESVYLLDYFAIVKDKRDMGFGSSLLSELKEMWNKEGKRLVLEVENPEYETDEDLKNMMNRRISFYKRNEMLVSGVTCNFYNNEYRILYAGTELEDTSVYEMVMRSYKYFFGEDFVKAHVVFHDC